MTSWREELVEAVKSKTEREAELDERRRQRLKEALTVADDAMQHALAGMRFTNDQFRAKKQPSELEEQKDSYTLKMRDLTLTVGLAREDAVLTVSYNDGRPREFDFAKDRHLAPRDVEEYVGRRAVELARAAQKTDPW